MKNKKLNIMIAIPSYNRPHGSTFEKMTISNWYTYIYKHDKNVIEYEINYDRHVKVIETEKRNLAMKRQIILNDAIKNKVDFLITIDDDVRSIRNYDGSTISLKEMVNIWINVALKVLDYVDKDAAQICSSWQPRNNKSLYANNAFGSHSLWIMKNVKRALKKGVKYNEDSECEDIEFSADLIANNFGVYRTSEIVIESDYAFVNSDPNGGLSYKFVDNRNKENEYVENLLSSNKYTNVRTERRVANGKRKNSIVHT